MSQITASLLKAVNTQILGMIQLNPRSRSAYHEARKYNS